MSITKNKSLTKTLLCVLAFTFFSLLFIGCENFLKGEAVKNEILDSIAYNNAPSVTVLLKTDPDYGDFFSDGEKSFKVGYDTEVQFTVNQNAYVFKNLEAVTRTAPYQDRSSCVEFKTVDADEKKGIYKIKVKILERKNDIMIRPVCEPLPKISSITPALEAYGCNQDSSITITFNKTVDTASFKDQDGKIKGISITNQDGEDLTSYFAEPVFASDNKSIYIQPLSLSDNTKFILAPDGTKNSLNIEVNYTFIDAADKDGYTFTVTGSHTYKINKSFTSQENITILVQNKNADYGSFFVPGEKSCIVGFSFEIEFTLNKEAYTFEGFEAVSKNSEESRASFIAFEDEQFDNQSGIYKAKVRILKYADDILIRPKCKDIINADVTITSPKGTKSITPANGTIVKSYINHEYSLSFVPDDDYEFIRWELYDTNSADVNSTIPNGTYVSIKNPRNENTTFTLMQMPEAAIKPGIRAVTAERPRVISNSPIGSGILKDSTIIVLFDRDMDENSIYYEKPEITALINQFSLTPADLLPENAIVGQTKIYGYKKDGQTYFKNISITDKKTGKSLAHCFDQPVFEDSSTLAIPIKDKGKDLADYTQILVSIEKEFFCKVDGKDVQLYQSERWMYQINDQIDKEPLIFATRKLENGQTETLFSVKLSATDASLKAPDSITGTLDYNKIKDLDFMKDEQLYLDLKLQEPKGSGPKTYFSVILKRVYDENYNADNSSEEIEKLISYNTVTADDAMFKGSVDLSDNNLPDGVYQLYFVFGDRSENDFIYPNPDPDSDPQTDDAEYFYIVKDKTPISPSGLKISSDNSSTYTLSWTTPTEKDYAKAVISWGNDSDDTVIERGYNSTTFSVYRNSIFNITISYKDYAGNSKEETIPKFLTGYTCTEIPSFSKYGVADVFFNGDNYSDYNVENTVEYWSDGTTVLFPSGTVTITPSEKQVYITLTHSQKDGDQIDITKTAQLGTKKYYVAAAGAKPTSTPVKLTDYSGSLPGGTYFKFGDFPQTISYICSDSSEIIYIGQYLGSYSSEIVYNGWYLGSDGYFYEKCAEHGSDSSKYTIDAPVGTSGNYKYFKVEPIVWRQLNGVLLFSEKALTGMKFYDNHDSGGRYIFGDGTVSANNWLNSRVRAYLNGDWYHTGSDVMNGNQFIEGPIDHTYDTNTGNKGFLQIAFTPTAQNRIQQTWSRNSASTTQPYLHPTQWWNGDNPCAVDASYAAKIFLLSTSEVTDPDYGFPDYNVYFYPNDYRRVRIATDYAKANGVSGYVYNRNDGCKWWLRSPYFVNTYDPYTKVRYIGGGGNTNDDFGEYADSVLGVVPALCVSDINLLQ